MIYMLHKNAFIPGADTIKSEIMSNFITQQSKIQTILQVYNIYFYIFYYLNFTNYYFKFYRIHLVKYLLLLMDGLQEIIFHSWA
jgi:hypothetical protein